MLEGKKVAATIDQLEQADRKVVLTAAPDKHEMVMIARIQGLSATPHLVSLAGQPSLPQLAALIDCARLFIGVDSAPMHMAATPYIELFGPTKLQFWRPWGDHNRVIWAGDYGPLPHPDTIDTNTRQRYLSTISVEDVVEGHQEFFT